MKLKTPEDYCEYKGYCCQIKEEHAAMKEALWCIELFAGKFAHIEALIGELGDIAVEARKKLK